MKAFDTVPHEKLISVLESEGIRGRLLNWIKDYLSCRTQSVRINNDVSAKTDVVSGVPQGSVSGPLFFIIYTSDISKVVKHGELYFYANDCKLSFAHDKSTPCGSELQDDLNAICDWADKMQLKLSAPKCKVLILNKFKTQMTQCELFI